ncbi:coiled-coil domain-containing protein 172-like [Asterias rubens]|uniref:coiled-coil domain-containing protein 172-like n=1 Tax=Asterias rubens TaxID=7604 RepID=UPI001455B1C4|nr:coiled-coil domain-containing protein 172-like [Asterias rubens]
MSLNDLFVQILHSEQKAKERKTLLNEVKNEINEFHERIKELQEECTTSQGQLVVKIHHQTEAELSLSWLQHRENILKDQLTQVMENRDASAVKLESLEAVQTKKYENFIQEISDFNQTHDLCGQGTEHRETKARQRLCELKQQESCLLAELSDHRDAEIRRNLQTSQKMKLLALRKKLQNTSEELHMDLEEQSVVTKKLIEVKSKVAAQPQVDPEYLRMRKELEACHDEGLEGMCHALQQEVDRLQREHWQRQLQRQTNQAHASFIQTNQANSSSIQTNQASSSSCAAQPQSKKNFPRKKQLKTTTNSTSETSNSWSSFRITHSAQPTPFTAGVDQASSSQSPDSHTPLARDSLNPHHAIPAVVVKKEPLQMGGIERPNLAKLRREIEINKKDESKIKVN